MERKKTIDFSSINCYLMISREITVPVSSSSSSLGSMCIIFVGDPGYRETIHAKYYGVSWIYLDNGNSC
jgi:hypothetical protein